MSDTNCPNCGASAWYRAGDGTKNYDCGTSSLSSNPSELCQTRRERDEAIRARDVALKVAHTYDEAHTKACERWAQAERERDEAREKIKRQAERIRELEGATNHAGGLYK